MSGLDEKELLFFFFDCGVGEGIGLEVVESFDFSGELGFKEGSNQFSEFSTIIREDDEHILKGEESKNLFSLYIFVSLVQMQNLLWIFFVVKNLAFSDKIRIL